MLPEDFVRRIASQPYLDTGSLCRALNEPAPVSIRLNPAKWSGIPSDATRINWCDSGWYLSERPSFTLDPLFHAGCYYPQEASSMFLEYAFRQLLPEFTGLKILDLCGAPGGKSTHLSSLLGDKGFLVANEVIRTRASVLAENVTKWGLSNTIVTNSDPGSFARIGAYFDLIVADAPCSGEGMFRDVVARNEWSPSNAAMCAERQRRIVMDVWPALKQGGHLIYSTCTFNPAENEENIKWLSEQTGATNVTFAVNQFTGISEISFNGITGYGFHPGRIMGEGFFIAVFRKNSDGETAEISNIRPNNKTPSSQQLGFTERFADTSKSRVVINNEILTMISVPEPDLARLARQIRIIKHGSDLFRIAGSDYIPLHDLAMNVKRIKGSMNEYEVSYEEAIEFLRKGKIEPGAMDKGWVLLTYKGAGLGFVKNLGKRVNNNYPVEWRIRMNPADSGNTVSINWQ